MTDTAVAVAPGIDLAAARAGVEAVLDDFLDEQRRQAADPGLTTLIDLLADFIGAGGKRVRPLLCLCGWYAGGGSLADGAPAPETVWRVAASLELFHAFALIHDDIMDGSDTRRGRPTVHRAVTARCGPGRVVGAAERFGVNSAILLGDLALVWSDELLHASGLAAHQLSAARPFVNAMRTEVSLGQYLDLLADGDGSGDLDTALAVVRYKTAKYTVERPLHIGATIAGADRSVLAACTAFALPIGEAFQFRDDVLGVFGDPAVTGKSRLDDLRDGKSTVLTAIALGRADPDQRATLRRLIGDPGLGEDGAAEVRDILTATGARGTVESMIAQRRRQALDALDRAPFPPAATAALSQIAHAATVRAS